MKWLIFDGTNCFHRNFAANPTADANGNPVGGVMGSIKSIRSMLQDTRADRVIFVWDGDGGAQRRRGIIAEYKAGRKPRLNREVDETAQDSADNFAWQASKLKALLGFLGVAQLDVPNIEADDAIGYLVGLLDPQPKVVVSSDRDMWQLVSETTSVWWPGRKTYITKENFKEASPILPENFVLARAISGGGDKSDNIHGIHGLGEKTILKLFPELSTRPFSPEQLFEDAETTLRLNREAGIEMGKSEKRWLQVILDNRDLVSRNVEVMQLTTPNISTQAAATIRAAAEKRPSFNMTGFKLALLNNSIQLLDNEMFPAFQDYKIRSENSS